VPRRYPQGELFVANTDRAWFDHLRSQATDGVVDEVNFWLPKAQSPMKTLLPGEPVFFRLKRPWYAIAGYGFFAHFVVLDLDLAWSTFGWKNGDPDRARFFDRIAGYRGVDVDRREGRLPLACTVLREAHFWPEERWIPWGEAEGWSRNIVQGATVSDAALVAKLLAAMQADGGQAPGDFASDFQLLTLDERARRQAERVQRSGQGAFRLRLLSAYENRCAITGEHTLPVLDAAHIQPYLGAASNHPQNGIVLTKEFHTLFDEGYVGITPDHVVRVSERLKADYQNGKRYYPYDGQRLVQLPGDPKLAPSRDALAWHLETVFKRAG
jgi:putative restriction endonuclease